MKQIPLTQGKFAIVDDEDFEELSKYKWHVTYGSNGYFYARTYIKQINKCLLMHRFITNTPNGMICDHINHDTLDNRKSNLRVCTTQENNMNKNMISSNTKYKNIWYDKKLNVFTVSVQKNKKHVFYKRYKNIEEAIQARDEALKKYHGEFANKGK